jgi:hypothetical protein
VLGPNVLTAEYKINYLKPAHGKRLIARASVIGAGGDKQSAAVMFGARPMLARCCAPRPKGQSSNGVGHQPKHNLFQHHTLLMHSDCSAKAIPIGSPA